MVVGYQLAVDVLGVTLVDLTLVARWRVGECHQLIRLIFRRLMAAAYFSIASFCSTLVWMHVSHDCPEIAVPHDCG